MIEQRIVGHRALITALLIIACLCFGGSASITLYEMGLSIFALVCLVVVAWSGNSLNFNVPAKWFIVAFVSLVMIQIIPLPDLVWKVLPQGQFAQNLPPNERLEGMWSSLSIAPDQTLYSVIAATPALTILLLVATLSHFERHFLANILVVAALCQAIIGISQATDAFPYAMYDFHHPKVAIGLFASRNHFADLIMLGAVLLLAMRQSWSDRFGVVVSEVVLHASLLILFFAMVGSASRAGLALFGFVTVLGYVLSVNRRHRIALVAAVTILGSGLWATLEFFPLTGIAKTTAARFEVIEGGRWEIWKNSQSILRDYWPWGAGLGGFRQTYEQIEPLQIVTPSYVNAVHNEYFQIIIEAGGIGVLLTSTSILYILICAWRRINDPISIFSFIGILAIIMHSLVDYPLRVMSINVVFACLGAFVVAPYESPNRNLLSNKRLTEKEVG